MNITECPRKGGQYFWQKNWFDWKVQSIFVSDSRIKSRLPTINSEIISNIEVSGSSELNENESDQIETKTSVRKLSLFDNIEEQSSSESATNITKNQKKEPMFENQLEDDNVASEQEIVENSFDPEAKETDEDFNQESDEELLDIPTFLRRQAN